MKIRFIEPGNRPYKKSPLNLFVYERTIRTPSNGMITLATILNRTYEDVYCYSESISKIAWDDVLDADVVCIGMFTFAAERGYALADYIRANSDATVVMGGLHPTLNPSEAIGHADFVLLGEGDETITPLLKAIEAGSGIERVSGVVYRGADGIVSTGDPVPPHDIDSVPNRHLLHRFKQMAGHNTLWPQVHASRGCPHRCDYCSLVAAFGRGVRTRSPEAVLQDIREAIEFFDDGHRRLAKMLWITDDNFFADRAWATTVLQAIIDSDIDYEFTIQARYEVGFDDEMLDLLKRAGFSELAMGIEFLDDESFQVYHKASTRDDVIRSIENIQRHGLRVRGLFIMGADNHAKGVGDQLADFVIEHGIEGVLIQSMYFIPGTPVYETHRNRLVDEGRWGRCVGAVVHEPALMSAEELQREIIRASKRIYSPRRLVHAIVTKRGLARLLFVGEFFWQASVRSDLRKELPYLAKCDARFNERSEAKQKTTVCSMAPTPAR